MKKLIEHTYGSHIYMKLELDGKIYEVNCYCGSDNTWNHYKTTADGTPDREKRLLTPLMNYIEDD